MADDELRNLERAWRETADPAAGVRYVRARLRAGERPEALPAEEQGLWLRVRVDEGELDPELLALAAHGGHAGARAALGPDAPPLLAFPEPFDTFDGWLRETLARWGAAPFYELLPGLVAQVTARAREDEDDPFGLNRPLRELLDAVEAQVAAPSKRQAERVAQLLEQVEERYGDESLGGHVIGVLAGLSLEPLGADADEDALGDLEADLTEALDLATREAMIDERACLAIARAALVRYALRPRAAPRPSGPRDYSPRARFEAGDVLVHPKFGQGEVVRAVAKQVVVRFPDGERKLAHGL